MGNNEVRYDMSVVMGSKNRKNLIKATVKSIRENGFQGKLEIIVVDGGSIDGTCDWLAKQKDVYTIIQPNFSILDENGIKKKAHSWGEFMNLAFKACHSDYICMVSDDLILAPGCLQSGYDEIHNKILQGEKIGGGAFFFREFPRHDFYRVIKLPQNYININHGIYYRPALEAVGWLNESDYNFYCGDGDIAMRLNISGYKTIALENSFADHLVHMPSKHKKKPQWYINDKNTFNTKYPYPCTEDVIIQYSKHLIDHCVFWRYALKNVVAGYLLKLWDRWK